MALTPDNLIAQVSYPLVSPGIPVTSQDESVSMLETVLSNVIGFATLIAIIYFTIQIILTGFAYITAHGDKNKLDTARSRLSNSFLGIIIVLTSVGLVSLLARFLGLSSPFDWVNFFDILNL